MRLHARTRTDGVNVTDHELTFNSLSDVLLEHVTPYVVLLQAKECPGPRHFQYSPAPRSGAAPSSASSALMFRQRVRTNHVIAPSDLSVTTEDAEDGAAPERGAGFRRGYRVNSHTCSPTIRTMSTACTATPYPHRSLSRTMILAHQRAQKSGPGSVPRPLAFQSLSVGGDEDVHHGFLDVSFLFRLLKIYAEGVPVILTAPDWPRRFWFADIVCLLADSHWRPQSGIKQLLQKLLSQLMGCGADFDLDEEDDYASVSQRKMNCTMASLSAWYQKITKKSSSPKKKRPASLERGQAPQIVVVFKDLESFPSSVLQEFIVISSRYCKELPLVLVFGIATSPMIIHRLLSHSVSSLLCIELFQSSSCTDHLSTVVNKLLLSNQFPFKLSGRVLQVLITIFLYHDFSVQNFIKGLQLSVVEHFNSQPLSVLCCDVQDMKRRVKTLSHNQCENIRHLASFMRCCLSRMVRAGPSMTSRSHERSRDQSQDRDVIAGPSHRPSIGTEPAACTAERREDIEGNEWRKEETLKEEVTGAT
ncbi:unnamed protein product [Ranitomeya imitator]|uniref:Origin recognition complex subunit 3 N-terminal domain-containing protein n=1 Tax=Ranitomeya imitator TaxID=111125 RepID=A0ABN9MCH0_9NEOB|nr:unnamed protein product [Ranitomeya imitator]